MTPEEVKKLLWGELRDGDHTNHYHGKIIPLCESWLKLQEQNEEMKRAIIAIADATEDFCKETGAVFPEILSLARKALEDSE